MTPEPTCLSARSAGGEEGGEGFEVRRLEEMLMAKAKQLEAHPTPYTQHPTPYTLHPSPFTPHPTPYTLHPTP